MRLFYIGIVRLARYGNFPDAVALLRVVSELYTD